MNIKKPNGKVVIVGSGFVGSSAVFALALGDVASEVVLVDVNKEKARGEALDISHGLSFVTSMSIRDGGFDEVKGADIVVITAGSARKPGETRLDLAKKNVSIAKDITKQIMEHYDGAVIVVVSNPVDILTYIIQKESGIPANKVIGSGTILDTSRFRYLIGDHFDIDVRNIHGYIIGEHGDSMVPLWSLTNIEGANIDEIEKICKKPLDRALVEENTKTAGAQVIKLKGATYYAIAISISRIVEAILQNQHTVLTVGSVVNGQYGLKDVSLSLPTVIGINGIENILEIDISKEESEKLQTSAAKLKEVLAQV